MQISVGSAGIVTRHFATRASRFISSRVIHAYMWKRVARARVNDGDNETCPPCQISLRGPSAVCRNDQAVKARPVSGCRIKPSTER